MVNTLLLLPQMDERKAHLSVVETNLTSYQYVQCVRCVPLVFIEPGTNSYKVRVLVRRSYLKAYLLACWSNAELIFHCKARTPYFICLARKISPSIPSGM
jgi:hypothetical protein